MSDISFPVISSYNDVRSDEERQSNPSHCDRFPARKQRKTEVLAMEV
ncbi:MULTISPECIES: hypothetical protein [unclassified Nostoc]|nr:hypothetical protein [Nostoc sp. JL33]MBN3870635.1 hypothetical protein [Nostoc sp. JL33]